MCRRWFSRDDEKAAAQEAARAQRQAAEEARAQAQSTRADIKEEDVMAAVEGRTLRSGTRSTRGGVGRRSLFAAGAQNAGFLGRFR
jgi:hypothetical protein